MLWGSFLNGIKTDTNLASLPTGERIKARGQEKDEMKAVVVESAGKICVKEVPQPNIGEYDALVKILACAICNSTDVKVLSGKFPLSLPFPGILGHESIGRVIQAGSRVAGFKVGDIVTRPSASNVPGYPPVWGGFAEFGIVRDGESFLRDNPGGDPGWMWPMQQCLPPDTDPVEATMLITFKEILSWLRKIDLRPRSSVLIIGMGPMGLSMVRFCKLLGIGPVIAAEKNPLRAELAEKMGADAVINPAQTDLSQRVKELTKSRGVDCMIDAVGDKTLVEQALGILAPEGAIAVYGIFPKGTQINIEPQKARGEWSLLFKSPEEQCAHEEVLDAVKLGFINPRDFISHVLPMEEIEKGLELLKTGKALKVVLKIG
jgi:threonine dehydrogenase-like Zn-dependent dehydrogenase